MALFPLQSVFRGVIYDTRSSGDDTHVASRAENGSGQHFLQSPKSRTFALRDLNKMTDADVEMLFRKLRWPETDGEPVCPKCGSYDDHLWMKNQSRWKCRDCRHQFTVTSKSIFAYHKMSLRDILTGVRTFILNAKGCTAIALSKELGCDYKTAFVMLHKLREAQMISLEDVNLEGEIEIDGGWFGGYIKPENVHMSRIDRRKNPNGKRRVVVGARERGPKGRSIVSVFDSEAAAISWLREKCDRMATIYADDAKAWLNMHASHKVEHVNHSERYAEGPVSTNLMESLFSRMRRFEVGTHHHIAGPYLARYANDAAWRENNRREDDRSRVELALGCALRAPQSRSFGGYWQHHGGNHVEFQNDNPFAGFA